MRVLIYGGREFGTTKEEVKLGVAFLDKCAEGWPHYECDIYGNTLPDVTVISGGAKGADTLGIHWATINWTGVCPALGIVIDIALAGREDDQAAELDRIVPSKGYIKGNVVFLSRRANRIKNDARPEELRSIANWLESL